MHSPLVYETPIIESNEDTVGDTNRSLEEKVNLLNIDIIAMKSFIEDQMLVLRHSRKDTTLQKSSCDHNSEIARLTRRLPTYITKTEPKVALYRYYLKMTTHNKNLRQLIRVIS